MKLICLQENIKDGLFILERIASKNQNLPILNNIILKTEKGFLKTFATDLEVGVEINIPCKIEKEGEVVLPVKTLSQFISNLPNTKIIIEEKNNKITIESDNIKTTIPVLNKDEFPLIPKIKKEKTITIKPNILKNGIAQVLNSVAISHPIQEILGVLFVIKDGFLKIISTDSFRLSEKIIYQKNNYTTNTTNQIFILPQKTAQELVKIINQTDDVEVWIESNQILFALKNTNLISRLISGNYPNYEQIIPKKTDSTVLLDKNELMLKIKLASLFSSKINDVKLILNPNKKTLELRSADQHKGEFNTVINAEIKGEGFEVVFNYKYILDGLTNIADDNIVFEFNKPPLPSIIRPQGDDYKYIIMPIKI